MATNFPPLKNDLLLRAARGEETEHAPVWVMRQAGRYLPEFRKVRESHEFFEVCRTPELATIITLQPIERYTGLLDASIIFSDILVVPQAMGMEVQMNPGPYFPDPLVTPDDIKKLTTVVDVNKELGYVFEAITRTRKELKGEVPLIGFCGAPWTLFAYMIEGGGGKGFQKAKTWLFKYPEESQRLLQRIADVCIDFLVGQVKAGAQLLQVFDSWAGELSPHDFKLFSLPTLQRISEGVHRHLAAEKIPAVPMTCFAKGANHSLGLLAEQGGYDVLGLDWCIDPAEARRIVGDKVALQGNMDPTVLYGGRDAIESAVKRMAEGFKPGKGGWIANLGHGITPGVDPEDLRWFLECVHKYSSRS
ncbi:uroporphyrinogen decarboxylase [Macrolepiota fuliginosa MF-IS2]|uniref:Uroporphyrinogen decarboxylase n=1 Tax=Macrolepiota fuliginosa MF-IS2 TaxID=1400762 RepID=A0A9P5XHZ8_9AGAR|nr:uroporphyrinogen decarboxylase [Macrolepiota fuliginosa MF-IS2]